MATTENQAYNGVIGYFETPLTGVSAASFAALISWGDGNFTAGSISNVQGNLYEVTGEHTYVERGTYPIIVFITGPTGYSVFSDTIEVPPTSVAHLRPLAPAHPSTQSPATH